VLIRAPVQEIVVEGGKVTGVQVQLPSGGKTAFVPARRVVSSAGYVNTFSYLVKEAVTKAYGIPKQLSVPQSAGFVMANLGTCITFLFFFTP
jgi:choline dehydrogenase-like flavoprotein